MERNAREYKTPDIMALGLKERARDLNLLDGTPRIMALGFEWGDWEIQVWRNVATNLAVYCSAG